MHLGYLEQIDPQGNVVVGQFNQGEFVAQAKALGYEVILVFIHLEELALNQARIIQRVSEGGHNVPEDKVAATPNVSVLKK